MDAEEACIVYFAVVFTIVQALFTSRCMCIGLGHLAEHVSDLFAGYITEQPSISICRKPPCSILWFPWLYFVKITVQGMKCQRIFIYARSTQSTRDFLTWQIILVAQRCHKRSGFVVALESWLVRLGDAPLFFDSSKVLFACHNFL